MHWPEHPLCDQLREQESRSEADEIQPDSEALTFGKCVNTWLLRERAAEQVWKNARPIEYKFKDSRDVTSHYTIKGKSNGIRIPIGEGIQEKLLATIVSMRASPGSHLPAEAN